MLKRTDRRQAQAVMEFILLTFFVAGALLVFQKYFSRGFSGRWKATGDAIGSFRSYDPNTVECSFDYRYTQDRWYNQDCFEEDCIGSCYKVGAIVDGSAGDTCRPCIESCYTALCD